MDLSSLNLVVAGTDDNILMVEAGANELPEEMMLEALKLAHESMQPVVELIKPMRDQVGKPKVEDLPVLPAAEEVKAQVREMANDKVAAVIAQGLGKHELKDG